MRFKKKLTFKDESLLKDFKSNGKLVNCPNSVGMHDTICLEERVLTGLFLYIDEIILALPSLERAVLNHNKQPLHFNMIYISCAIKN